MNVQHPNNNQDKKAPSKTT